MENRKYDCSPEYYQKLYQKLYSKEEPAIPDDGYADGGEPYTDEELKIINQ